MTLPWFRAPRALWPAVAGHIPQPWPEEAAVLDLAYWDAGGRRPSRRQLADRWGWSEWNVRALHVHYPAPTPDAQVPPDPRPGGRTAPPSGARSTRSSPPESAQGRGETRPEPASPPQLLSIDQENKKETSVSMVERIVVGVDRQPIHEATPEVARLLALQEVDDEPEWLPSARAKTAVVGALRAGRTEDELADLMVAARAKGVRRRTWDVLLSDRYRWLWDVAATVPRRPMTTEAPALVLPLRRPEEM